MLLLLIPMCCSPCLKNWIMSATRATVVGTRSSNSVWTKARTGVTFATSYELACSDLACCFVNWKELALHRNWECWVVYERYIHNGTTLTVCTGRKKCGYRTYLLYSIVKQKATIRLIIINKNLQNGPNRDLNPGPPPPKGGIIPLDHRGSLPLFDDHIQRFWLSVHLGH